MSLHQSNQQQNDIRKDSTSLESSQQQSTQEYPGSKASFGEKKDFFENLSAPNDTQSGQEFGGSSIGSESGELKSNLGGSIGSQGNLTTGTPGGSNMMSNIPQGTSVPKESSTQGDKYSNKEQDWSGSTDLSGENFKGGSSNWNEGSSNWSGSTGTNDKSFQKGSSSDLSGENFKEGSSNWNKDTNLPQGTSIQPGSTTTGSSEKNMGDYSFPREGGTSSAGSDLGNKEEQKSSSKVDFLKDK